MPLSTSTLRQHLFSAPRVRAARWLPALGVLALAACNCEGDGFRKGDSSLTAEPDRVDLGRVFVGASRDAQFLLQASGQIPVRYTARFEGGVSGFVAGPATETLAPGGSVTITVRFAPRVVGPRMGRIVFESDATMNPRLSVEVLAVAVEAPDCEDGNGCTEDVFDPELGRCLHTATAGSCDDFNACTMADMCLDGLCGGPSLLCDDSDVCTDDVCDPRDGCRFIPTRSCDDGNPCTRDLCDANGCRYEVLPEGTPCDDFEPCTNGDICLLGQCRGINIPNGTMCDDGDPCSKMDQCTDGVCLDPTYVPPLIGQLKYTTVTATLAEGGSSNPIVDRDSTTYLGTQIGITAIDQCGDFVWTSTLSQTPNFAAAASLPGLLIVPLGPSLVDFDASNGLPIRSLDLRSAWTQTSSSSSVSLSILDVAVRASGALVASVERIERNVVGGRTETTTTTALLEIDQSHSVATRFVDLGTVRATRIAVDREESLVTILREGEGPQASDTLVRFGLEGVVGGSWSTSPVASRQTELSIAEGGRVLWTAGLLAVSRRGERTELRPTPIDPATLQSGAAVADATRTVFVERREVAFPGVVEGAPGGSFHLVSVSLEDDRVEWEYDLPGRAVSTTPAIDARGNSYVVVDNGTVIAVDAGGNLQFQLPLPLAIPPAADVSLTLDFNGTLIVAVGRQIFGIKSFAPLAPGGWPRHRHDNLSTGHH